MSNSKEPDSDQRIAQIPTSDDNADNIEIVEMLKAQAPDVFSGIPTEKQEKLTEAIRSFAFSVSHYGPLPRPQDLALYVQYIPNGGERIMQMAEKQLDHRIRVETKKITEHFVQTGRGQIFGLVIGLTGIFTGAWTAIQGHDWVGAIIGGTTVVSLSIAFITGQRKRQNEQNDKPPTAPTEKNADSIVS